jgi:hypothetical protein
VPYDDGGLRLALFDNTERGAEVEQRQRRAVSHDHGAAGERMHGRVLERDRLDDARHRQRIALVADSCDQAAQHTERHGQRQGERRPFAARGSQVDGSAERLDGRVYDVETDATTRDFGDLVSGGESRQEEQVEQTVPGQGRVRRDEPSSDRGCAQCVLVDAGAVVTDLEDDGATGRARRDGHRRVGGLTRRNPLGRRLATMVDGVDHEVLQRVGDAVEHLLVELDVLPDEHQAHVLAGGGGDITDDPR